MNPMKFVSYDHTREIFCAVMDNSFKAISDIKVI